MEGDDLYNEEGNNTGAMEYNEFVKGKTKISLSKSIYKRRKGINITSQDIYKELIEKKDEVSLAIKYKRFEKSLSILNQVCFKHMMPKSILDETKLTPYNTLTMETYNLSGYINVSEIRIDDKMYFASQVPHLENIEVFVELLNNSSTKAIVSLVSNNEHLSHFECYSSTPVLFKGEVLYYNETYILRDCSIKVFRFANWKDHTIISKEKLEKFYETSGLVSTYPLLVHCRAGVGRTGFFIMYDVLRTKGKISLDGFIDILCRLRSFRSGLVWTPEQLSYLVELFVLQ